NLGVAGHEVLDPISLTDLKRLFRYLIARYGAYAWMNLVTQEYNSNAGSTEERRTKIFALAEYIKSIDPYNRLLALHLWPIHGEDASWDQPWNDYIMDQGGHF